jgi:hypothetical protein
MSETVVRCSHAGCHQPATHKVAAPWRDGRFSELKTYGFACPSHSEAVVADAVRRRESQPVSPGELVGHVSTYPLPRP